MDSFPLAIGGIILLFECLFVLKLLLVVVRGRAAAFVLVWARIAYSQAKTYVTDAVGRNKAGGRDGETDILVRTAMAKHNVSIAALVLRSFAVLASIRGPSWLSDLLIDGKFWGLSTAGMLGVVAVMALSCSAVVIPRIVNSATLTIWHLALMASFCVISSPAAQGDLSFMIVLHPLVHVATALISLVCISPSAIAMSNLCLCACITATFVGLDAAPGVVVQFIAPLELLICVLKLIGVYVFRRVLHQGVVQEVQASAQRCQRLATSSLLDVICDAVVDLDAGLSMLEHFPKFANMLMHGSGRSLAGVALREYVMEDGVGENSLEQRMSKHAAGGGGAAMFPGHLRDALGNRLKVLFFHVPYTTASGLRRHLVGIQEERDDVAAPPALRQGDSPAEGGLGLKASPAEGGLGLTAADPAAVGRAVYPDAELSFSIAARLERRRRRRSRDGASSASSSGSGSGALVPTADIVVDDGLRIRGSNPAFVGDLGLRPGPESFLAEVLPDAGAALLAWMRDRLDRMHSGALPAPHIELYDGGPVAVGAARDRQIRVLFPPPPEAYAVSVRFERRKKRDERSLGRGTAAAATSQTIRLERRMAL